MATVESYYDTKSASYDDVFDTLYFKVYDAITWRYLEPYIPSMPNALILDAGGGTGRWAIRMAKKGCRVVLLDVSDGMLNMARKKIEAEGLQRLIEVRKGDIRRTDYPAESFDMVLCEHTLFLFQDHDEVLGELVRVLKKDAPIVLSAQNRYAQSLAHLPEEPVAGKMEEALSVLLRAQHNGMTKDGAVKIYTLTPGELRGLLERNGLRIEKIVCKGVTAPLRLGSQFIVKKDFPQDVLEAMLKLEFAFCEREDALALAGHLQAVAYKL